MQTAQLKTVLFVDDEPGIVTAGRFLLASLGYEVVALQCPKEARQMFSQAPRRFDLVITDINMPGMNGLDLARQILELRPETPVLLCTGGHYDRHRKKMESLGITELLLKPLTREDLAAAVSRKIGGPRRTV